MEFGGLGFSPSRLTPTRNQKKTIFSNNRFEYLIFRLFLAIHDFDPNQNFNDFRNIFYKIL